MARSAGANAHRTISASAPSANVLGATRTRRVNTRNARPSNMATMAPLEPLASTMVAHNSAAMNAIIRSRLIRRAPMATNATAIAAKSPAKIFAMPNQPDISRCESRRTYADACGPSASQPCCAKNAASRPLAWKNSTTAGCSTHHCHAPRNHHAPATEIKSVTNTLHAIFAVFWGDCANDTAAAAATNPTTHVAPRQGVAAGFAP